LFFLYLWRHSAISQKLTDNRRAFLLNLFPRPQNEGTLSLSLLQFQKLKCSLSERAPLGAGLKEKYTISCSNLVGLNGINTNQTRASGTVERRRLKVRFHHHILPTNWMTNSLTKSPYKQMSHIFDLCVSQKFVVNQISLLQTH
jgi:hypothetical protein